jgi:trans-aconitate methyltransferase
MWNADLYDDKHSFVWKHGAALVELLAPKSGEAILDLGCGTGHLTAQIAAAGASVLGIDSSRPMIEKARQNFPELSFEVQDALQLPYADQFDAVFSNAVLHWIKEAELVAQGVARSLKTGGRFVAEFGGKGNVRTILAALKKGLQQLGIDMDVSPWFYPTIGEYAGLLERVGLEVTFATLFDRPTPLEGKDGMRHWVEMFRGHLLEPIPSERREELFRLIDDELRPVPLRDGTWFADYRRLRVVAWRR